MKRKNGLKSKSPEAKITLDECLHKYMTTQLLTGVTIQVKCLMCQNCGERREIVLEMTYENGLEANPILDRVINEKIINNVEKLNLGKNE